MSPKLDRCVEQDRFNWRVEALADSSSQHGREPGFLASGSRGYPDPMSTWASQKFPQHPGARWLAVISQLPVPGSVTNS